METEQNIDNVIYFMTLEHGGLTRDELEPENLPAIDSFIMQMPLGSLRLFDRLGGIHKAFNEALNLSSLDLKEIRKSQEIAALTYLEDLKMESELFTLYKEYFSLYIECLDDETKSPDYQSKIQKLFAMES